MWGKVLADYLPGMFFVWFSFCLDNEIKLAGKSQIIFSEFHALIYDGLCPDNQWAGLKCSLFLPAFRRRKQKHFLIKKISEFFTGFKLH